MHSMKYLSHIDFMVSGVSLPFSSQTFYDASSLLAGAGVSLV